MEPEIKFSAAEIHFFTTMQLKRFYRGFHWRFGDRVAGVKVSDTPEGQEMALDFHVMGRSPRRLKLNYSTSGGLDYLVASTEVGQAVTLNLIEAGMRMMSWLDCPGYTLSLQHHAKLILSYARRPNTIVDAREFYHLTLGLLETAVKLEANLIRMVDLPPALAPEFRHTPEADA